MIIKFALYVITLHVFYCTYIMPFLHCIFLIQILYKAIYIFKILYHSNVWGQKVFLKEIL